MLAIVAVAVILLGLLHIEVSYILQYFTGYCVARAGVTSINKRQMRFLTAAMFVACMTRLATRHYLDGTRLYDSVIALLSWNVLGIWLVAVLVCICQKHVCWVEKMVASKAWRHLDALSYPLYVAHYPFLQGLLRVNNYIENTMVQFLAFVAFTVLLAEALLVLTTRGQANR